MRLLFRCLAIGFMLMLSVHAKSQSTFTVVQGKVLPHQGVFIEDATIALIHLHDSVIVNSIIVSPGGFFKFPNVAPGTYGIRVKAPAYKLYYSSSFQVDHIPVINLPDVNLTQVVTNLKEVVINNKKAYIENRPDKTVLNIEKGGLAAGVSVFDVLATAPGIRVNQDGEVLFKGGQKALIAINGRMGNLSGPDMAAQLQNMQSGDIGQIELVPNPSAKYEAAGGGGLINIVLKKGKNEGFNGSVNGGAGYGNFYKLNSGVNLNYRAKKLNVFGSYSFSENNTGHSIITNRYVGTLTSFNVDYYNTQTTYASNYTFGTDYTIDAAHTLGLLIVGSFNNNFLDKHTQSAIANNGVADSTLVTGTTLNRHVSNINYNLNYNGKLGHTAQTIAADADYSIYNRNSAEDLNSILYNAHTGVNDPARYFRNEAPTRIINYAGRVDYADPLSKTTRLEAGLKYSYAKSDNAQRFDNVIGALRVADPLLSSRFNYAERIAGAYANYIAALSGRFDYQLDVRVEHTGSDANGGQAIKRSYTDFFPVAVFNYRPSANHGFTLTYNRRIDRPTYQELNPIIAFQDKYNVAAGNAYLRPSYQDRAELKHNYKNKLITSVYASLVRDAYNFTYFAQDDLTNVYTTGKLNLKHANTYGVDFNGTIDLCNWWNINIDADISYQRFADYAGRLNKGTGDAIFKLTQQFQLPAGIGINLFGQYEVPTFYAIYHYRASYNVRAAVSKLLFHDRATLNFTVQDLFNTDRDRFSSNYANLNLMGYDKKETQIMRLGFAYRFGKSTIKASRRHTTGNIDDLKRMMGN